jgi:hypothetical protein
MYGPHGLQSITIQCNNSANHYVYLMMAWRQQIYMKACTISNDLTTNLWSFTEECIE